MALNLGTRLQSGFNSYAAGQQFLNGGDYNQLQNAQASYGRGWQQPPNFSGLMQNALGGGAQGQVQPNQPLYGAPKPIGQAQQVPQQGNSQQNLPALLQTLLGGQAGTPRNPYAIGGNDNNPYAITPAPYGGDTNTPQMSAQGYGTGVTPGMGGAPTFPAQNTNGYEQFFQGGGVPQQEFNLSSDEQKTADAKAARFEGWRKHANTVLKGVENFATPIGGAIGTFWGPVGSAAGSVIGKGASLGAGWGRQQLQG